MIYVKEEDRYGPQMLLGEVVKQMQLSRCMKSDSQAEAAKVQKQVASALAGC